MISSSLKMWCGHLLQITDKKLCCIDEKENSQLSMFPSGEQVTRRNHRRGLTLSISRSFSLPLTIVSLVLQSDTWRPAGMTMSLFIHWKHQGCKFNIVCTVCCNVLPFSNILHYLLITLDCACMSNKNADKAWVFFFCNFHHCKQLLVQLKKICWFWIWIWS